MEIENQEQEIQMSPELFLGIVSLVTSVNGQIGDVVLTAQDVNALPDSTLYAAALSLTINPTTYVLTGQLLDQNGDNLGEAQSIDLPLESMVVSGSYDDTTKSVVLTLKNGQTISFSVADLVSGLQTEITPSSKLASDLVDDTGQTNKFITQTLLTKLNDLVLIKSIGSGLSLDSNNELSAPTFTGTDGVNAGTAGIVPAPATTDSGKFLKADGTWDTAGSAINVVQTTGTSQTDVMSQKATTKLVYSDKTPSTWANGGAIYMGNLDSNQVQQPDPTTTARSWKYFWALPADNSKIPSNNSVNIMGDFYSINATGISIGTQSGPSMVYGPNGIAMGSNAAAAQQSVAIGSGASAGNSTVNQTGQVAIGANTSAVEAPYSMDLGGNTSSAYGVNNVGSSASITIGKNARVGYGNNAYKNSVALGSYAEATRQGEINVGLVTGETTGGYNDTPYRVIGGVHDPVDSHDAATKGYVDSHAGGSSPVTLLTSADNNYDSSGQGEEPDSIAAWLLSDGWYIIDSSTRVYLDNSPYMAGNGNLIQVMGSGQYILSVNGSEMNYIEVDPTDGTAIGGSESADGSYSPLIVNFWDLNDFYNSVMLYGDSAPDITTHGALGQLFTDTTTLHTYQCTAVDDTDPSDIQYTWTMRW